MTQHRPHPLQAIPIRLGDEQVVHLTRDWQATLCGDKLPRTMTWPAHYRRGDCRVCWQLAKAQGLTIERQR